MAEVTTRLVKADSGMSALATHLRAEEAKIALLLPEKTRISANRLIMLALEAAEDNPRLKTCTPESWAFALHKAAVTGLEPGGVLGEAAFVPFANKRQGTNEVALIPQYQGLVKLAYRGGFVKSIRTEIVYERDTFDYQYGVGQDEYLKHKPATGDKGEKIGGYAIVELTTGGRQFKFFDVAKIEEYHRMSPAAEQAFWTVHWDWMACKTVLKQVLKLVPKSADDPLGELLGAEGKAIEAENGAQEGPKPETAKTKEEFKAARKKKTQEKAEGPVKDLKPEEWKIEEQKKEELPKVSETKKEEQKPESDEKARAIRTIIGRLAMVNSTMSDKQFALGLPANLYGVPLESMKIEDLRAVWHLANKYAQTVEKESGNG